MAETYGELLSELVDEMAQYADREEIFRRNEIKRNHFYNVTNPNRRSSSDKPYHTPTEWGVRLTRDSRVYTWIKTVARDCGGLFISPEDVQELQDVEPEKALEVFRKIVGMLRKGR